MPDIDIDFSVRGRERVIRYVGEKYGRESVAQIITFGTMAPRQATRDAARVLGFDYGAGDRVAKLIPEPIMGRSPSFDECLKDGADLKKAYDTEPDTRQIVDTARGLEGIVRNNSIHAAAVVIADRPLQEVVPLQLAEDRGAAKDGERSYKIVTQYSMVPVEEIGLLKMDFLGLRNLDVIEDAVEIVRRSRGIELDVENLPLDDEKTYEMLRAGDSVGVFQLESEGMRDALKQVGPTEFGDIVALVSLYRPGAMRYIADYARGKRDPSSVRFQDERLRPITEATYGCCIYQEQLMEISKQIAGFSPARADDLRKAIGKKKRDMMATMEAEFREGASSSGTDPAVSRDLWNLMTAAADYSFNKSHAACYALIAYRTAYLKANFPAEYMAAVISSVMSTKDKVPFFVNRCEEMGIEVLPPDVNESDHGFVVSGNNIRFGLDAVKNVGHSAVEAILKAREERPFDSLWDFCERVDARAVNKRATECLIKCGGLDSTQATRKAMLGDAAAGAIGRSEVAGGCAARPGLDLRPRRGHGRRDALPASADPRRGVRAARVAGDGEGDDGNVPLRPSALAGPRGAPGAGRLHARRAREEAGRRPGDRRRDHRRGEEDPDQDRLQHDVRHARRPRGPGRADHLREDAGGERRADRYRRRPAGARPGRSQGPRRDQGRRLRCRAVRADQRRGRDGQGGGPEDGRAHPLPAPTRCRPLRPLDHRGAQIGLLELPRRCRGRTRDEDPRGRPQAAVRHRISGRRLGRSEGRDRGVARPAADGGVGPAKTLEPAASLGRRSRIQ